MVTPQPEEDTSSDTTETTFSNEQTFDSQEQMIEYCKNNLSNPNSPGLKWRYGFIQYYNEGLNAFAVSEMIPSGFTSDCNYTWIFVKEKGNEYWNLYFDFKGYIESTYNYGESLLVKYTKKVGENANSIGSGEFSIYTYSDSDKTYKKEHTVTFSDDDNDDPRDELLRKAGITEEDMDSDGLSYAEEDNSGEEYFDELEGV